MVGKEGSEGKWIVRMGKTQGKREKEGEVHEVDEQRVRKKKTDVHFSVGVVPSVFVQSQH